MKSSLSKIFKILNNSISWIFIESVRLDPVLNLLPELSGHLVDGSVLCLWDNEPDVGDEDNLGHHEDDEYVGSNSKLE